MDAQGRDKKTGIDVGSVMLKTCTRYGFHLMELDGKFRYTNGNKVGDLLAFIDYLTVYEGAGLVRPFNTVYNIWI